MLKLIYYVPESHLEQTKQSIFSAGAGEIGNYQECAWQIKGIGQFRPINSANPFLGKVGDLEQLEEWRVEIVLDERFAQQVKQALLMSHPYEVPAYEFIQLLEI